MSLILLFDNNFGHIVPYAQSFHFFAYHNVFHSKKSSLYATKKSNPLERPYVKPKTTSPSLKRDS